MNERSECITNNNNKSGQCELVYYKYESGGSSTVLRKIKLKQSKYIGHTYNYIVNQIHKQLPRISVPDF